MPLRRLEQSFVNRFGQTDRDGSGFHLVFRLHGLLSFAVLYVLMSPTFTLHRKVDKCKSKTQTFLIFIVFELENVCILCYGMFAERRYSHENESED